jgi:hypothetical protein
MAARPRRPVERRLQSVLDLEEGEVPDGPVERDEQVDVAPGDCLA